MLFGAIQNISSRVRGRRPLSVRWFSTWHSDLDAALSELPEMPTCSHDLFRLLMETPSPTTKRTALVIDEGEPIAVIGLRRRKQHWLLITDMVTPFAFAPAAPGRLFDALSALHLYLRIADWNDAVPGGPNTHFVERRTGYRVPTRVDLDAFWKTRGTTNMDTIRKARNRCDRLGKVELEIDAPGAAAWTINNWSAKWSEHPFNLTSATSEILAAANWLAPRGLYRSFRLMIDGEPVAGVNLLDQGDVAHALSSYRDPRYAKSGTGVRLDELVYRWAATSPYSYVDLGCGDDYREKWGEPGGLRSDFVIAPRHLAVARQAVKLARSGPRSLMGKGSAGMLIAGDGPGGLSLPDLAQSLTAL